MLCLMCAAFYRRRNVDGNDEAIGSQRALAVKLISDTLMYEVRDRPAIHLRRRAVRSDSSERGKCVRDLLKFMGIHNVFAIKSSHSQENS